MAVELQIGLSILGAVKGFMDQKKADKQRKQSLALQRERIDKEDQVAAIRNKAEKTRALRAARQQRKENLALSFQGQTGGGSSTTAAANSAISNQTAVNFGVSNQVTGLASEARSLQQQAIDLSARSQASQRSSGFFFNVAQNLAPSAQEFEDIFTS